MFWISLALISTTLLLFFPLFFRRLFIWVLIMSKSSLFSIKWGFFLSEACSGDRVRTLWTC